MNARIKSMTLRIKRVFNTLKERIRNYAKKIVSDNVHYTKMASFALVSAVIPLSMISALANNDDSHFEKDIILTKNSQIVAINTKTTKIIPGESQVQIEARKKVEAEAKTKSQAKLAQIVTRRIIYNDPQDFDIIYQSAGSEYGIDWRILKAIHYVETGCSGSTYKSNPSGATGPMQFMPSTWRVYGVDGNGDGFRDISNVSDAIYGAANYLRASGGSINNYKTALWSYNPSSYYYSKVMMVAKSLGF